MIVKFKSRKEAAKFLKEKGIDTSNWTEEKWQSINKSQAEIHIQVLAEAMWDAMNESEPEPLVAGMWHIPFISKIDSSKLKSLKGIDITTEMLKISTARCARLSYMTFDGDINYEKDIKLHDRLLKYKHMSPFEHVARAMTEEEYQEFRKGKHTVEWLHNGETGSWYVDDESGEHGWCNNFKGFIQYRYLIEA